MKLFWSLALLTGLSSALAGGAEPLAAGQSGAAIRGTVALFDRTPLVAIGELHGLNEQHAFFRQLIADPAFGRRVNAVVVEFGNARHQAVADAFVLDKRAVSIRELRQVWRNTTQSWINTWDAPIYEQFFRAVRAANGARPHGQPAIRVILGDPPIDWAAIKTTADTIPFGDRDGFYARMVEREVLARGQRALLITGLQHVLRLSPPTLRSSGGAIEQIEAAHPGSVSVVMPFVGFPPPLQDSALRLSKLPAPTLLPMRGSWVGKLNGAAALSGPPLWTETIFRGTLSDLFDAVLVLGDPQTFTNSVTDTALYLEPGYAAELLRRKRIFGVENDPVFGMRALLQLADPRWRIEK